MSVLGGSDSTSKQTTKNEQQTASDQAINFSQRNSGNLRETSNIRLGKDAELTINQGLSAEDFQTGLTTALQAQAQQPTGTDDAAFKQTLLHAIEQRTEASTDKAVDEAKSSSPSKVRNLVIAAVGLVVVLALVVFFRKGKS